MDIKKEVRAKKQKKEQQAVACMIHLYCRKNHMGEKGEQQLCADCTALLAYARQRSENCPFMAEKNFCVNCKVHCYRPDMREKIRRVMRFSGPRMMFHHPGLAIWHLVCSKKEKGKNGTGGA